MKAAEPEVARRLEMQLTEAVQLEDSMMGLELSRVPRLSRHDNPYEPYERLQLYRIKEINNHIDNHKFCLELNETIDIYQRREQL